MWLLLPCGLIALVAVHELVVYAVARAVGAETSRRVAIVIVRGRRRGALAFLGGAVAGYLVVAAMAFSFFAWHGIATGRRFYGVLDVRRGYDAFGKLEVGDRIVAVDGEPLAVDAGRSLVERVNAKAGAPVTLSIERGSERRDIAVQPLGTGSSTWLLGIVPHVDAETVTDIPAALAAGLAHPILTAREIAHELRASVSPPDADPGGPKRIVDEFEVDRSRTNWWSALRLMVVAWLALTVLDLVRAAWLLLPRRA